MDSITELLKNYGEIFYVLILIYCALKSGWLPLFAGYAAYSELLSLGYVVMVTFWGGYLGDELRFYVARRYGVTWIKSATTIGKLFEKAKRLASQYGIRYIFFYRYPKGLRTIGAIPIGLTDISWSTFTIVNASSAAIWTIILVGSGYLFGEWFEQLGIENLTAFSIVLMLIFLLSLYRIWRKPEQLKN